MAVDCLALVVAPTCAIPEMKLKSREFGPLRLGRVFNSACLVLFLLYRSNKRSNNIDDLRTFSDLETHISPVYHSVSTSIISMLNTVATFGSIDIPIVSTGGGGKSAIAAIILCSREDGFVFEKFDDSNLSF